MKDFNEFLRNPMKVKPASKRAARQKSSVTPDDVYRLNYNESPFGPSPKAALALAEACKKPFQYPDWMSVELKNAIADLYGLDFSNVVTGSGSSALICMLGEIFLNEGDEVVLGDPSYEAFRDVSYDYGAKPVIVPLDSDLKYDFDAMLAAITPKTKMVVIVNPNNPTGTFVDSAKVEEFFKKVPDDVITVVDEAYLEFVTKAGTYSMVECLKKYPEKPLIVMKTFSKIYGMAGVRVGYSLTTPQLADCLSKSSHAWNMNRIGQIAGVAAIKDQEYVEQVKNIVSIERDKVSKALKEMGCTVYESQTNFILFKTPIDSLEVQSRLAESKVLIGAPRGYNRVSLGFPEMNDKFIECMKKILASGACEKEAV